MPGRRHRWVTFSGQWRECFALNGVPFAVRLVADVEAFAALSRISQHRCRRHVKTDPRAATEF
jgi:hypothetical protein